VVAAAFYTYTWIERILGAGIDNLDHPDPHLQSLSVGDRIWLTPERYLGRLPGQYWTVAEVEPGRALILIRRPLESPLLAAWAFGLEPQPDGRCRLLDRHRRERAHGALARASDEFGCSAPLS
jgi:hypothetical protein